MSGIDGSAKRRGKDGESLRSDKKRQAEDEFDDDLDLSSDIKLNSMKFISSHIQNDVSKWLQKEYFVYFVPHRTIVCEKIFEEEKVHHSITFGEYPLYILPLDEDVLSCELDFAFLECLIDGDTSALWHVANAIHKLAFSFGLIPTVQAKGKGSTKIVDIFNSLQVEEPVNAYDMGTPEINMLILIDRDVNMVAPMCFQLTYEGLFDEILQVNNDAGEVEASILGVQQ